MPNPKTQIRPVQSKNEAFLYHLIIQKVLKEEQNLLVKINENEIHFIAITEYDEVFGTAALSFENGERKISKIAIVKGFRHLNYEKYIRNELENWKITDDLVKM